MGGEYGGDCHRRFCHVVGGICVPFRDYVGKIFGRLVIKEIDCLLEAVYGIETRLKGVTFGSGDFFTVAVEVDGISRHSICTGIVNPYIYVEFLAGIYFVGSIEGGEGKVVVNQPDYADIVEESVGVVDGDALKPQIDYFPLECVERQCDAVPSGLGKRFHHDILDACFGIAAAYVDVELIFVRYNLIVCGILAFYVECVEHEAGIIARHLYLARDYRAVSAGTVSFHAEKTVVAVNRYRFGKGLRCIQAPYAAVGLVHREIRRQFAAGYRFHIRHLIVRPDTYKVGGYRRTHAAVCYGAHYPLLHFLLAVGIYRAECVGGPGKIFYYGYVLRAGGEFKYAVGDERRVHGIPVGIGSGCVPGECHFAGRRRLGCDEICHASRFIDADECGERRLLAGSVFVVGYYGVGEIARMLYRVDV